MDIRLVRHATLLIQMNNKKILVDPMLSPVETMPPIQNSTNDRRNPLVPLALPLQEIVDVDAVMATHTHRDHFDDAAAGQLPKTLPVFCQKEDEEKLKGYGFTSVHPVVEDFIWEGITMIRTGGQHGTGEIGQKMGPVSGFVLQSNGEPTLYVAGDTIYCAEVQAALDAFRPDVTIVNAGAAQFAVGEPITMNGPDVAQVCMKAPYSQVVAVHMETINHCLLTRQALAEYLQEKGLRERVQIPADGELMRFFA